MNKIDKCIKILEINDFNVDLQYNTINKFTPLGEDWYIDVELDSCENLIKSLNDNIEYIIDEDVEMYIDCRGKNGIPSDVRKILEDGDWKKDELRKVIKELEEIK